MTTLRTLFAIALAALALWAQAPQGAEDQGKATGKSKGGEGKAGRGGRGGETKALVPPPDPQVLRFLRPDLYLITGEGGNTVFRATPLGVILADTKLPKTGNYERLEELIRGITPLPVKFVLSTHNHPDHAGNNDRFKAAGAEIIATGTTFSRNHAVRLAGVEAQANHFASGHTASDAVIFFPADRVVVVGDLLAMNRPPAIDYAAGGTLAGAVLALDALWGLQWDVAIPGHGDPVNRAFVETYRTKLRTLIDRAREAITRGVAKEQFVAQIKTDDLGWQLQMDPAQLDGLYAELSPAR